jgi:gliding motility-associated-like protein
MLKTVKKSITIILFIVVSKLSMSMDVLGGYISWKNNGTGRYILELTLYRDCNGTDLTTFTETIKIWNHPSVTEVPVNFINRVTVTPTCTEVSGSPQALSCGTGDNGGNGIGAIEKILYASAPFDLNGKPPTEGWSFTFETLNRKTTASNLFNANLYGMTLSATMFESSPVQTNCMDNSPRILNDLNFIACNSDFYDFVQLMPDDDFDQVKFSFANPLKNITAGAFQLGINPLPVEFKNNFNAFSPTPGTVINSSNQNAVIHPTDGDISFLSNTTGEYVVKFVVDTYRNGKRNASIDVEFTVFVVDCSNANNAPTVSGPFGGLFEYSGSVGDNVSFTINSSDVELLQNGDFQTNIVSSFGAISGSSNCLIAPCATISPLPAIQTIQGASTDFNWQTTCDHLKNQYGNEFDSLAYDFVFKFQDNYCQIPKITYKRVRIILETTVELEPAQIACIQTLPNGEIQITRTDPENVNNVPVNYRLNNIQTGLSINMPATTLIVPAAASAQDFFITTTTGSPCPIKISSDTLRNIFLTISPNPDNSIATLSWNKPYFSSENQVGNYIIMREYPLGVWTQIAELDYNTFRYNDTIDICNAFINYAVIYNGSSCLYTSNITGEFLQDGTIPDLPEISSVSIDTLTNLVHVSWNVNPKVDTYGYIIYMRDENGIAIGIDTVYGRFNTSVLLDLNTNLDVFTFSIAAFDSCLTDMGTFYSTTGKSYEHTSIFLENSYDICARTVNLKWSPYLGWDKVDSYDIFARIENGPYILVGSTTDTKISIPVLVLKNYDFVVRANQNSNLIFSFSNKSSVFTLAPTRPSYHYTKVVTVVNNQNVIKHTIENNSGVKEIVIERQNEQGDFDEVTTIAVDSPLIEFIDTDVKPKTQNYTYRVILVDSCGFYADTANMSRTILLNVKPNHLAMVNYLNWTPYTGFAGSIAYYNLYRGFEGKFFSVPLATLPPNQLFYYDTIFDQLNFNGQVCYYVEAIETVNSFSFSEISRSNEACAVFEPLIYIPNSFTPNDDHINNIFKPEISLNQVLEYELVIMNRWGEQVFRSENQLIGWDGINNFSNQICQQGSYLYILKLKDGDNQELIKRGYVNLLR